MSTSNAEELYQELPDRGKARVDRVVEILDKEGIHSLVGECIDVDSFQLALELAGYRKGRIGRKKDNIWYRNVVSDFNGYIAELECRDPSAKKFWRIVVDAMRCTPVVIGVQPL